MSDPLRTLEDYELFLCTLPERFKSIRHSTVTLVRRGASLARVSGEIHFDKEFRLVLLERIVADRLPATIEAYGYEIWRSQEKLLNGIRTRFLHNWAWAGLIIPLRRGQFQSRIIARKLRVHR
jgi:hypothetical protein